jgi:DegV family protein with EDD domain
VSVHLSTELSGTCQAAVLAARRSPIPVEVVDTRTVAMAAGYAVIDAAEAARRGEGAAHCAAIARATSQQSRAYFYVDTLEYLRRGGRIGAAQRYVGQALQMKPLLGMSDGGVVPLEKVRTAAKALARLVDLAVARCAAVEHPRLAVQHLQAQESADKVAQGLAARVPGAPCLQSDIGAVLGVHTGPGVVAVMVVPGAAL